MTDSEFETQNKEAVKMVNDRRNGVKPPESKGEYSVITLGKNHRIVEKPEIPVSKMKTEVAIPEKKEQPATEELLLDEDPEVEFKDVEIPEYTEMGSINWMELCGKVFRSVAVPLIVSAIFFWGMLRGECTKEFALPISWACSGIALFFAGFILAMERSRRFK